MIRACAALLLASVALCGCGSPPSQQKLVQQNQAQPMIMPSPTPSPQAQPAQPGVLRYPDPGEGPWKQWYRYTSSKHGEVTNELYRLPGDDHSPHYDLKLISGDEADDTEILDGAGRRVAHYDVYPEYFGLRKTQDTISLFFLFPDYDQGNYVITTISKGKSSTYHCQFSVKTLSRIYADAGKIGEDKLMAEYAHDPNPVIDFLTASDPDVSRDECALQD